MDEISTVNNLTITYGKILEQCIRKKPFILLKLGFIK